MKRYHVVPFLAFLWAFFHITVVRHLPNHAWKGGGFGMYTEPSPPSRRVFIGQEVEGNIVYKRFEPNGKKWRLLKPQLRGFTAFPSKKHEQLALNKMLKLNMITADQREKLFLVISEIRLNSYEGTFKKNVIYDGSKN